MLMSAVNMMLRDKYISLAELCEAEGIDETQLCTTLGASGFEYSVENRKFW